MPVLAIAAFATLSFAGCGGDDGKRAAGDETATEIPATSEPAAATTKIAASEYAFDPAELTVESNSRIELVNEGDVVHNLTVSDTAVASDVLSGGENDTFKVALPPGEYYFLCTIGTHADLGMEGTLTVK